MAFHSLNHQIPIDDQLEGVEEALHRLKLSYDYLGDEKEKVLFLMCSMFPEDYTISIEDLIRYAIGLGLGGRVSLEISRVVIEASINRLLESCLLMNVAESKEHVKMHDLVRDTALWIAEKSKNHKILVNVNKPFNNMVKDDDVKDCFAITSWYERDDQIYNLLHAPNLKILLIRGFLNLSHATFKGIEGLQILSIINDKYLVPVSIQFLTNLRTLRLKGWALGDISFISCLKKLQILDLQHCRFNELPNDLGNLENLKLLDLSYCHCVQSFNYNGAIGGCLQLEELYLSNFMQGQYYSQCVEDIITLQKLERFVSYSSMDFYCFKSSRLLHALNFDFDVLKLHTSKRNLLQLAEVVHFEQLLGEVKNLFPDIVRLVGGMNRLKYLRLTNCSMIKRIFDSHSDSEFDLLIPKLVELDLKGLKGLKELIRGTPLQVLRFFDKLEKLQIRGCPRLHKIFPWECNLQKLTIIKIYKCKFGESLFSICNAQSMHLLKELSLEKCDELKHIIAYAREKVSNTEVESIATFPLHSSHFVMPRLKRLSISSCRNLVSTFPICSFEVLKKISIIYAPSLKLVFGECDHQHLASHQCQNQNTRPDLNYVKLYCLESLVGMCPENNRAKWPSSKRLEVAECPKLNASWIVAMTSSKIKNLRLTGFWELSLISRVGPTPSHILNLQCLKKLDVGDCKNLKYLFSMEMHRSLPELINLTIYNCNQLEQIVLENEELVKLSNVEVCFPKLEFIVIYSCNKMRSLFSVSMATMLPRLTLLTIENADKLEEVFRHDNEDNTLTDTDIVLPNLAQIELKNLPSFVDICNCKGVKLKMPKLLPSIVVSCAKIVPNFVGIQTTPLPEKSKVQESETGETQRDYDLDLS